MRKETGKKRQCYELVISHKNPTLTFCHSLKKCEDQFIPVTLILTIHWRLTRDTYARSSEGILKRDVMKPLHELS